MWFPRLTLIEAIKLVYLVYRSKNEKEVIQSMTPSEPPNSNRPSQRPIPIPGEDERIATSAAVSVCGALISRCSINDRWQLARTLAVTLAERLQAGSRIQYRERDAFGVVPWLSLVQKLGDRGLSLQERSDYLVVIEKGSIPSVR